MPLPRDPSSPPSPVAAVGRIRRFLYRCLAVISLLLAVAGLILPGLPCTEFLLLASWAAARSSPRLHGWILRHRIFGPLLANWQRGIMPRKAKWVTTLMMSVSATVMYFTVPHLPSVIITVACMSLVLIWLWYRPET
ncbi:MULTISPECIES: YbaN family protein [Tatumella]|uniref:Inner membrane protein n=1 Tax=Tatumella punctata TaxID=399969 RepID=A0ABW1VQ69_9GAMM|nr:MULTISPECIES: YbaN family protein [unclassified Tatumella]MBS0857280.1 YbaN family protein [Tatumella sp. JGM16]MBS0878686.1 YbaN family protein [Tatumella sp. JGM82]MBS0891856.1 YbaN family protein [Tatumella sp. JGM94]MBS0894904.1 YbaN family protein [Tatumella sp. JGM130]MBS0903279.1 YbaN family protein [Tatumella sp. JGM100]